MRVSGGRGEEKDFPCKALGKASVLGFQGVYDAEILSIRCAFQWSGSVPHRGNFFFTPAAGDPHPPETVPQTAQGKTRKL